MKSITRLLSKDMNKSKRYFRTTNLDLACVLVSEGHVCKTKKIGPVNAEFVFEETSEILYRSKEFYKGECNVMITAFMYARFALKRELAGKTAEYKKAHADKIIINPGQFYYFVGDDGKPYKNVYANKSPHTERLLNGNMFLTMNEAQVVASNSKND